MVEHSFDYVWLHSDVPHAGRHSAAIVVDALRCDFFCVVAKPLNAGVFKLASASTSGAFINRPLFARRRLGARLALNIAMWKRAFNAKPVGSPRTMRFADMPGVNPTWDSNSHNV